MTTTPHQIGNAIRASRAAFNLVAGAGIRPSEGDIKSMTKLAQELEQSALMRDSDNITFRVHPDTRAEGISPVIQIMASTGEFRRAFVLADCWIEHASTPEAYFYWES